MGGNFRMSPQGEKNKLGFILNICGLNVFVEEFCRMGKTLFCHLVYYALHVDRESTISRKKPKKVEQDLQIEKPIPDWKDMWEEALFTYSLIWPCIFLHPRLTTPRIRVNYGSTSTTQYPTSSITGFAITHRTRLTSRHSLIWEDI